MMTGIKYFACAAFIALVATLCSCVENSTTETAKAQNNPAKKVHADFADIALLSKGAKVSADKKSLAISAKNKSYAPMAKTAAGLLKPDTDYVVKLNVKVTKGDTDKDYIHIIIRDNADTTSASDIYRTNVLSGGGKISNIRAKIHTPAGNQQYTVQIHSHGNVDATIADFEIFEGTGENFYAATPNAKRYKGDLGKLPTGAPNFTIDLPRNQKEIVVNAADLGLDENVENCVTIINKALELCKKIGASKLVLPKGKYKCYENGSIAIRDFTDFTFDAQGSTLVFRKEVGNPNMMLEKTLRTKICNLNFDWDWDTQPLASVVQIANTSSPKAPKPYIDFKFVEYEKHPNYNGKMRVVNLSAYDIKAGSVGIENGKGINFNGLGDKAPHPEIKWLAPNLVRVFLNNPDQLRFAEVGNHYRMQHYYYGLGGLVLNSNAHTTIQNMNVFSCKGHAFVSTGTQQYFQFLNVNIAAPKGVAKRPITCTADHFHFVRSRGYFKMIGCEFSRGADDGINIHDCSSFGVRTGEHSVRLTNRTKSYLSVGELVELRNSDYSKTNFKAKVKNIRKVGEEVFVDFEEVLPPQTTEGFVMFGWNYDSSNILIKDCQFHSNRARGVLILGRNVTIEGCKFFRTEMGAIKFETGYTFGSWCEGYCVDNVVVRNCTFDTSNPLGVGNQGKERDIFMGVYMKTDPSSEQTKSPVITNILFENNTFKDTFGLVAFIASAENIVFQNNTIEAKTPRINARNYRGDFFVTSSQNIKVVNNTWVKSELMPKAGAFVDADNVDDFVFAGNKIIEK